jgi:signal transduction histidine kinase/ActR/RegA family two-component response regulator
MRRCFGNSRGGTALRIARSSAFLIPAGGVIMRFIWDFCILKRTGLRRHLRRLAIFIMAVLTALFMPAAVFAEGNATSPRHILYISSYSYSWGTVPLQIKGVNSAFAGQDYVINYEFMDTKNTVYSDGYREFYDLLKYKLKSRYQYDGIIVADDAALNFAMDYRTDLFAGIPITYLAVDNISNGEKAAEDPEVTGIVEQVDYQKNVEIAHRLMPAADHITFILDSMENGIGIAKQLEQQKEAFSSYQITYLNTSEYTREELCEKLASFTKKDIVFFISMGQQKNGIILTENERYQMIRQYASVPMFRLSPAGVGDGAVGGYVVDFEQSGRIAGGMLRQMLEQPEAGKPAMRYDTPGMYYFDDAVMKQYGLSTSLLPKSAVIINQPESFWRTYSNQIIIGLLLALLAASVFFLLAIRRSKKQLEINNRELAAASSAKTDFLSNMSHDLRTPLNGILGFAAIGLKKDTLQEKQQCLQKIQLSGDLLLGLVNDTLELSRIESGKMKLDLETFDSREIIRPILESVRQLADAKGVKFLADDSSFPKGEITADRLKLQKIVLNLLSNAVKFTPAGGTVRYSVESIDPPVSLMTRQIIVEDTGIGMSPEFLNHLYEPFLQERRPETAGIQGTGLGLAIVKRMVDLMHGTIAVESEIGKGTKFTVRLPLACAKEVQPPQPATEKPAISFAEGKHVLLCEDNAMNAEIARIMLADMGIQTDWAKDGAEGIEKFRASAAHCYDCILMDIRMLGMDGIEAARQIRALKREDADIPIIAMSADAFEENIQAAMAAGMNEYLTKPIDSGKLSETLAAYLGNQK